MVDHSHNSGTISLLEAAILEVPRRARGAGVVHTGVRQLTWKPLQLMRGSYLLLDSVGSAFSPLPLLRIWKGAINSGVQAG